jgi:hypothetical protein
VLPLHVAGEVEYGGEHHTAQLALEEDGRLADPPLHPLQQVQRVLGIPFILLPLFRLLLKIFSIRKPEMEFLNISLTKDAFLLLYDIHSPFYWRILKKTKLYSGFNNPFKKIYETRKLEFIREDHFVDRGRIQTKTRVSEESSLCPETSTKKCRSRIPSHCGFRNNLILIGIILLK